MINFNDFGMACICLFSCMIVNNWHVFTDMMVALAGGNKWYRLYFILFYYCSVVIGINILAAFVIDMYTSIENQDWDEQISIRELEEQVDSMTSETTQKNK